MTPGTTQQAMLLAFLLFLVAALFACLLVGPGRDEVGDFYAGGGRMGPWRSALALSGDYISAATVLGTTGTVALFGYDGVFVALSSVLSLGLLLLLAAPLRERGRFTVGDVFAWRGESPAVRVAAAVVTLAVCLPYLVVQLVGVGASTAMLLGLGGENAQRILTVMLGLLIVCATVFGGMRGASVIQIGKSVVLFTACGVVALLVLGAFGGSPAALLGAAGEGNGRPAEFMNQGMRYASQATPGIARLDFIGLQLGIVLGVAAMPHVTMRLNTSPDGPAARRSVRHALGLVAGFCLTAVVMGLGAAAMVGGPAISAADPDGNAALLQLAGTLAGGPQTAAGGSVFVLVACAVFLTALAVVAGITLAAAAAVGHDVHVQVVRRRRTTVTGEVTAARWAAALLGVTGIGLAVALQGWNIQFLSVLALTVAASSLLPATVYSLFWNGCTRTGLLWTLYGGLGCALGLQLLSPVFSGSPVALFPTWDLDVFPLQTVGTVSVPFGFLCGWAGSRFGAKRPEGAGSGERRGPVVAG